MWKNCRFSQKELDALIRELREGRKIMPIFNPGQIGYAELFNLLIRRPGIPFGTECHGFDHLGRFRRVDPGMMPYGGEFKGMDWIQRMQAYKEAYDGAEDIKNGKPSVVFTYDDKNPQICDKSPVILLEDIRNGAAFMDPFSDMIRWRRQYDRSEKGDYPDRTTQTMYPQYVYGNGRVPTMSCYEHELIFFLGDCLPDDRYQGLGARRAIARAA